MKLKVFSDKNLWRMKQFYETYRDADKKLSTLLREITPEYLYEIGTAA